MRTLDTGFVSRVAPVNRKSFPSVVRTHAQANRRQRTPPRVQVVNSLSPHRTLGVDENAEIKDIKRAYRKLAMKFHPDREGGSESHFLAITEAYEVLIGKREGKDVSRHENKPWDFHDWYWKYTMNRSWARQQNGKTAEGSNGPNVCTRSQVQSQLAGLRHRAAMRAVKQRNTTHQEHDHTDQQMDPKDQGPVTSTGEGSGFVANHVVDGSPVIDKVSVENGDFEEMPADSGGVEEGEESKQARFRRLQEEARRRASLNGSEAHSSVRSQLQGLRRRAKLRTDVP